MDAGGSCCGIRCAPPSLAVQRSRDNFAFQEIVERQANRIVIKASYKSWPIDIFDWLGGEGAMVQADCQALRLPQFSASSGCRPCWLKARTWQNLNLTL